MATTQTLDPETEPLNTPPNNLENTDVTFCGRLTNLRKNVTVEPIAFMALFSGVFASMATQTLALEKACRVSLNLSDEICDSLRVQNQSNNFSMYERMVQEEYSSHLMWKSALQSALPCLLLLFVGGWSDKTGRRKVIMLAPVIGGSLQSISNILNVIFFYLPLEVLIFFDVFFANIAGGTSVMFLALFNYICDITTAETRTHRLGLINLCTFAGLPLGLSLSGIILRHFGYYAIYGSALTVDVINIAYIILRISDLARTKEQIEMYDGKGILHFLRSFFDLTTIKDTFKVVFKKTRNNRTLRLCVLLVTVTLLYGPIYGEVAVMYMATRYRFNWDEVMFSIFQTYNFFASAIGTIFSITVFSKHLKWHDSVMGIISTVSRIASSFLFCFAPNEKIFLIGPVVDMFNGIALLAIRSIYSKFLEPNEIGKISSLVGVIENLTPLAYVSMYTQLYTATMDVLPGAIYLLGAAMTIPAVFVFIWLLWQHKKDVRREKMDQTNGIPLT